MNLRAFANKFKQPSSWAGIGVLLAIAAPQIPVQLITEVAAGVCALLAFFLNEKGPE